MVENTTEIQDAGYHKNLPVIAMLSLFVPIGIIGNSLILYVYGFRFKKSTTRVFILTLALLDLVTCVFLPYKVILMRFGSLFTNPHLARLEMIRIYFLQASLSILPLVSIDRYRRICKPFKNQISPRLAKVLVVIVCLVIFFPTVFRIVLSINSEKRGYRAEAFISPKYISQNNTHPGVVVVYFSSTVLPFCIPLPIMIIMYVLIGLRIRQVFKKGKRSRPTGSSAGCPQAVDEGTEGTCDSRNEQTAMEHNAAIVLYSDRTTRSGEAEATISRLPYTSRNSKKKRETDIEVSVDMEMTSDDASLGIVSSKPMKVSVKRCVNDGRKSEAVNHVPVSRGATVSYNERGPIRDSLSHGGRSQSELSLDSIVEPQRENSDEQEKPEQVPQPALRWRRMTLIFFLITVVNFVSVIPFLTFFVIYQANPSYGHSLFSSRICIVLYNFPYLTNVSNCFLYGFFDSRFRRKMKSIKMGCRDRVF